MFAGLCVCLHVVRCEDTSFLFFHTAIKKQKVNKYIKNKTQTNNAMQIIFNAFQKLVPEFGWFFFLCYSLLYYEDQPIHIDSKKKKECNWLNRAAMNRSNFGMKLSSNCLVLIGVRKAKVDDVHVCVCAHVSVTKTISWTNGLILMKFSGNNYQWNLYIRFGVSPGGPLQQTLENIKWL